MANYVLVHGAWHGGWCWGKMTPLLRAKGDNVYAPSLTGLGDRVHLLTPETDLETHIEDITNLIQYEDLSDVILVGHSYAGMVIAGVADRMPERIKHLVYLDAQVPEDGDSIWSLMPEPVRQSPAFLVNEGPFPPPPGNWGVEDEADLAWMGERYTPQPRLCMTQAVCISVPTRNRPFRRTYVLAAGNERLPPLRGMAALADRLETDPAWRVVRMPTGHDVMITMPQELADLLLAMA